MQNQIASDVSGRDEYLQFNVFGVLIRLRPDHRSPQGIRAILMGGAREEGRGFPRGTSNRDRRFGAGRFPLSFHRSRVG
jgi:hypothetical protein